MVISAHSDGSSSRDRADPTAMLVRGLAAEVDGVNQPWLYVGGLASTFAAHHEDCFLTGVNHMLDTRACRVVLVPAFLVPAPPAPPPCTSASPAAWGTRHPRQTHAT